MKAVREDESGGRVYEFGRFRVHPTQRALFREGKQVILAGKSFDLLSVLVQNSGRLLTKEFLLQTVWQDVSVEENSIAKAISEIRRALGEDPKTPHFIATVSKHGYRFLPKVTVRIQSSGLATPSTAEVRLAGERLTSLAVLPFIWLTSDVNDTVLTVGVADAIITKLSGLPQVVVRPTASILKYVADRRDPVSIASELGVDFVISGTLQQVDDLLRLTVQLVTPDQKRCIWADSFEETFTNLFAVEDSISSQVASALALKLTPTQKQSLTRRNTSNADAYQAFLRGRYFWSEQTFSSALKAIDCFRESLALDPNYAQAWAGMADAYVLIGLSGALTGGLPPDQIWPQARTASLRAIGLHDALAESHASLGFINFFYERNEQQSLSEFDRALKLQPNYSTAQHGRSLVYGFSARHEQSLEAIERALAIEPLSPILKANKGYLLYIAEHYDEAITELLETLALDATFAATHYRLSLALAMQKQYGEAMQYLETALQLSNNSPHVLAALGYVLGSTGQRAEAITMLERLNDLSTSRYVSPSTVAEVQVALGDYDGAFESLELAIKHRTPAVVTFRVDPRFKEMRSISKFADLLRRQ
jgi:DNA-binding winged helix-turn-helix (wHTH) protein/tetratricopeptide (TPR) repeat protein